MRLPTRFICNICGAESLFDVHEHRRETSSCDACGSNVRLRSIIHYLSSRLTGAPQVLSKLKKFPFSGIGLTDSPIYADRLFKIASKYTNTFYHKDPQLDICDPGRKWTKSADFLIASDVFEHVTPPVQRAFDGAKAVLKSGGVFVLTVPFGYDPTVEHFPDLHDFTLVDLGGERLLVNRDRQGKYSVRNDLVFHGGPGSTLEMRIFGYDDIVSHLEAAGFRDIRLHTEEVPEFGIFKDNECSLPITAIAP